MILRGSKLAQSICESRGYLDRRIAFLRLYTGVLRLKQERGEYSGRRLGVTFWTPSTSFQAIVWILMRCLGIRKARLWTWRFWRSFLRIRELLVDFFQMYGMIIAWSLRECSQSFSCIFFFFFFFSRSKKIVPFWLVLELLGWFKRVQNVNIDFAGEKKAPKKEKQLELRLLPLPCSNHNLSKCNDAWLSSDISEEIRINSE